jgi:hypothetical protein
MADLSPAAKRRKTMIGAIVSLSAFMMIACCPIVNVLPTNPIPSVSFEDLVRLDDLNRSQVIQIFELQNYSADPRYKSELIFWEIYTGDNDFFRKEYRMSKVTFDSIVTDCLPFLYTKPAKSAESIRWRAIRAKVTIAVLIRYLATQQDQYSLGKEFGVQQSCISKRIRRGYKALLSAYVWDNCPFPKITFPITQG